MFRECLLVPSIFVLFRSSYGASLYTASLDRAEIVNSTYSPGFYNISLYRINKINRTTFALNANLQFFVDIDENVFLEVEAHYKRLQNQDYMKSPYGMAHKAFPDHIKKHYELAKATLDSLAKCSNIPGVESIDKPYSWKKVHCFIQNFKKILIVEHFLGVLLD